MSATLDQLRGQAPELLLALHDALSEKLNPDPTSKDVQAATRECLKLVRQWVETYRNEAERVRMAIAHRALAKLTPEECRALGHQPLDPRIVT
jgi:hypothetical protein